uniref:Uncharacterized protein n=1 Tax=Ananas comosus var. bracteatus TaxID=296719 RepID=A0A6V7NIJ5_ANACO|nr:unnamed protein product [Ananas comosus var. bracteatus]
MDFSCKLLETETAKKNKKSRTLQETTHTAGTKSFARVAAEMKQKHLERKEPTCSEVYLKTHKYKNGDFVNDKLAADLQSKIIENQESSNSHGRVAWEGDAYSDVIGKDKYGYMRGVGLGPSPSELLKPMIASRFDGIQITTLDETISERNMRQMKEEIEKLQQQLRNQNETIVELKNKMQDLEPNGQFRQVIDSSITPNIQSHDPRSLD